MPDTATQTFIVTDVDTAIAVGSGSLPVLSTPRLVAWCEAVTCAAMGELPDPLTSVGTRVDVAHLAPSAVGHRVEVTATISERTERTVQFTVAATHGGTVVGRGTVSRAIVDGKRFMSKLSARGSR